MIRVAIVEDDAEVQGVLQEYIRRYTRQYGTEFEVSVFADGVDILEDYRAVYDIIFLDVEMKHLDGMTTAERIRQMDADVILIFITNMAQYAIRGYSVGALDYVLKPVPYFAFSQQLLKAVSRLEKRAKHYLTVPVESGLRRLDSSRLYYLESEGHRVHYYTEDGDFSAPGTLKAVEEKLAGRPFARCNSGYLVNLAQVQAVQQNPPPAAAVPPADRGHGGVGTGAGNLFAQDRLCAAGVVGALYALRGAAALRVPVGQPGGQLAGGTVHHRPGVSAGRVCCQRRMAAALLAVPAPERL